MVVPALTALLADPTREVVRDIGPLLRSIRLHQFQHQLVLLLGPGALD